MPLQLIGAQTQLTIQEGGTLTKTTPTLRLNHAWAERAFAQTGGVAAFAAAINADRSTVYRQLSGRSEAGPRFIASVLTTFPIAFDDAFDVVDTAARRRTYGGKAA